MDTSAWYAFGVPVYVLYIALEIVIARRKRIRAFGFAETISNLTAGLGTLIIGLFVGPWVQRGWDFVYEHVAPIQWPIAHGGLGGLWRVLAALLVADFCYYIYHRAGHRFGLFWSIHGIHHQHTLQNSSVGFRLEFLADPYAALFFGLMPLMGIDSTTGFFALMLLSIYALTAHSAVLARPSFGFLITPSIHGSHHSRDSRFSEKNYGAMFGFWDHLFGTWLEPPKDEELRVDAPTISRTHNGVATQFGLIAELFESLRRAPSLKAKLRILTSPPEVRAPESPLREDHEIGRATSIYVLVQFVALAALSAWILLPTHDPRPVPIQLLVAAIVMTGLYSLGGLLDGRKSAQRVERTRLAFGGVAGVALTTYSLPIGIAVSTSALLAVIIVSSVVIREQASTT